MDWDAGEDHGIGLLRRVLETTAQLSGAIEKQICVFGRKFGPVNG
jgi:hypothetical protein